jgi:hypothetical protein
VQQGAGSSPGTIPRRTGPLAIGASDDSTEREADAVADAVTHPHLSAPPAIAATPTPVVRRFSLSGLARGAWNLASPLASAVGDVAGEAYDFAVSFGGDVAGCVRSVGGFAGSLLTGGAPGLAELLGLPEITSEGPGPLRAVLAALDHPCAKALGISAMVRTAIAGLETVVQLLEGIWYVITHPEEIEAAIKKKIGEMIAGVPTLVDSLVASTLANVGPQIARHILGVWRYLRPAIAGLIENWWAIIKETVWNLLWPWPGLMGDLEQIWGFLKSAQSNFWAGEYSRGIDDLLAAWRTVNNVLGRFYAWIAIAIVLISTLLGAIFGAGAGALPGFLLGLEIANIFGEVLLVSVIAAELATVTKSVVDLARGTQTPAEDEQDYHAIAQSIFVLGITGAMVLLGELAARFARAAVDWLASIFRGPEPPPAPVINLADVRAARGGGGAGEGGVVGGPSVSPGGVRGGGGGGGARMTAGGEMPVELRPAEVPVPEIPPEAPPAEVIEFPGAAESRASAAARARAEAAAGALPRTAAGLAAARAAREQEEITECKRLAPDAIPIRWPLPSWHWETGISDPGALRSEYDRPDEKILVLRGSTYYDPSRPEIGRYLTRITNPPFNLVYPVGWPVHHKWPLYLGGNGDDEQAEGEYDPVTGAVRVAPNLVVFEPTAHSRWHRFLEGQPQGPSFGAGPGPRTAQGTRFCVMDEV